MRSLKTKNSSFSITESVIWRNAGTSVQGTVLRSDPHMCT